MKDVDTVPIAQTGLFTSAGSGKSEVEVDGSAVLAETDPLNQLFKFYTSQRVLVNERPQKKLRPNLNVESAEQPMN
jgi:hypothetical protein